MSLIMDALKKAQQLRVKGSEGSPILKYPHPDKKRGRGSKKQWILIGAGLISLCILLIVFLKPASSPMAIQTNRAMGSMERKPSVPVAEKISEEPPKEVLSLTKDEEPLSTGQAPNRTGSGQAGKVGLPYLGAALSGRPPQSQGEKASPETKPSPIEKRGESLTKQLSEEEELKPQKKKAAGKSLPLLPLATQKGEAPLKSIGVEQEGGKDRTLISDVLNHFNSGVHFYTQRELSKAIQAYQKVIELDPTYVEAYNNLGIIYQMVGDVDRAFRAYQKATEINPRYEKGHNNLGILLFLNGRYEEAVEAFQKALAINSNNIESHINLGILFKKKGQWEKAIESYRKALAIDPLHKETHYNMALLYEQLENLELAVNHYQQFIQLSSKSHPELVSKVQRHLNALVEAKRNIGK
jgi:tetratricopeptide (TPR) repeat protein